MLRTVASAFIAAVLIGCGTDSGSPVTMGPDAGPSRPDTTAQLDPVTEWATTHCRRRWIECAAVKNEAYVASCVAVAQVRCCTDESCSCADMEPVGDFAGCLESIRDAACDELGPQPACDPFTASPRE